MNRKNNNFQVFPNTKEHHATVSEHLATRNIAWEQIKYLFRTEMYNYVFCVGTPKKYIL